MIKKFSIGTFVGMFFILAIILIINNSRGPTNELDRNVISIPRDVFSINDAFPEVNKRATKRYKDAKLYDVLVQFNGLEEINSRKGIMYFYYSVRNLDYGFFKV